jgi:thymidylate kinase
MRRVAIIGPDGCGKSSVVAGAQARLGDRAVTVYMGLNPRSGGATLPTTRIRNRLRRKSFPEPARSARPELPPPSTGAGGLAPVQAVRAAARLANRIAEETARHVRIRRYARSGRIVLLDRDFLFDYDATDVRAPNRSLERRIHGFVITRLLPRPDLVVLLDAPADVLYARKGEWSLDYLERRRADYRAALRHARRSVVVDTTRPLGEVIDEVLRAIGTDVAPGAGGAGAAVGGT